MSATADIDPEVCERCGCTEFTPCSTRTGPCSWVFKGLCSACATEEELAIFEHFRQAAAYAGLRWTRPSEPRFRKVYA